MLSVLRINRTFMEKMRASKYAEETTQQFNMTLVEMDGGRLCPRQRRRRPVQRSPSRCK